MSEEGINVKKLENSGDWLQEVLMKAELIDYTKVSGCYVLRPNLYSMWEKAQSFFDGKIKKLGYRNASFPLLIPESLLSKESEHVAGFTPEVAWVTHHGDSEMPERLAVRPTSETIMYDTYKNWIRSHKDLPLLINQWANVIRWEFKNPVPLLRSREFLWQEGHTVFATKEEADKEVRLILDLYAEVFEYLMAIPVIKGVKSEKEKFAGADYTTSLETFLTVGKAIQCATSHHLGQNFAKAFDIKFLDKDEKVKYPYQNSWGFTTRSLGIMILMHGDDKGLVLPPRIAPTQIVIVPILFKDSKDEVLKEANKIKRELSKDFSVHLDDREDYSAGRKFNEWELKGIPLRIEIGPKDLKNEKVTFVRRDNLEKKQIALKEVLKETKEILEKIQEDMFERAKISIEKNTIKPKDYDHFKKAIEDKKMVLAPWCGEKECEEYIKDECNGAKSLNSPFDLKEVKGNCIRCEKKAKHMFYFGKSF